MGNASPENGNSGTGNGHRRAEQPRSWLQPFLLLALEQWQSHGYELIRRMSAFGFETLDRGSVYRTLRQLEKDGLVTSGWDTSKDGPARRLYTLTDAGRLYLEACAASLRGYQMMLNQFFSLYSLGPVGSGDEEDDPDDPSRSGSARGRSGA
jgi:poly-beta-hydroxybutyrate-responsive repressor